MKTFRLTASSLLLLLLTIGCTGRPHHATNSQVIEEVQQTRSGLDQAYDMLARIEQFERGPAVANVMASLTNHLSEQKPIAGWKPDPLVSSLPRSIRELPPVEQLDRLEVAGTDATYIEEAILAQRIGQWVVQKELPADTKKWLAGQEQTLGPETAQDLGAALLLFDWTIRNVQLDRLMPTPKDVVGPIGQGGKNLPAALRGIPGPGYTAAPWFVAMSGHGDAWQRGRLFIQLARQQGMDAIMLGVADASDTSKATPWACGVLLGDQIYLFDPAIGLPIPDSTGDGVATLAQVSKEPQLLRSLDVDDEHQYPLDEKQVKSVFALIDAPLEALSERMQILQEGLAGERQLKLALQPSQLAARLRKLPGLTSVTLWVVPFEATLFEAAFQQLPQFDPQLRQAMFEERMFLEQRTGQSQARYRHLRGQFMNTADEQGAKALYVEARVPDEVIEALATDADIQKQFGLYEEIKLRSNPEQRAAFVQSYQARLRRSKQDCSYWLGLAHYETGDYETAVNWLDQRTLKAGEDNWWRPGARYNLGRTYEKLAAPALAQEQYLTIEEPGELGALIRAKRLSRTSKAADRPAAAKDADKDAADKDTE
jgi:hypothetical protein